jgi:uncharacterized membrane protein YdbT with pleckstrin-like domain
MWCTHGPLGEMNSDMMRAMAISPKLLNEGERVVFSTRTHVKALLVPFLVTLLVLVAAVLLSLWTDGTVRLVVWIVAAVLLLVFAGWPFLNWRAATFTVTDRRLITRAGVLTRTGHDIPLNRISDVSYERGIVDRMLGCGTLVISDASTGGRVPLHDIPDVEQLHLRLNDELFRTSQADDGA